MFTAIPMPQIEWDEHGGAAALSLFGVVGLIIGAICAAVCALLYRLDTALILTALILAFLPHILSGFLHLDGFMDVSDAVLSHRDRDGRLKILKDAHCGSFAVIMLVMLSSVLLFCTYGAASQSVSPLLFLASPIISRSAAGLALLTLKPLQGSSLGAYFTKNKRPKHIIILSLSLVIGIVIAVCTGSVYALILAALSYAVALMSAYRSLGGINGDVTGFLVCITEAAMLAGSII